MATLYIPDPLHTEVYNLVSGRSPDLESKYLLKQRNEYINTAIREKLDRDGEAEHHGG
jgi:hypothetical protein